MPTASFLLTPNHSLQSPVLAASGTLGFADTTEGLVDFAEVGAFVTPTLTVNPRLGNPMPRTVEVTGGLIHATGLPNLGVEAFVEQDLPRLRKLPCPIIVSICGETPEDWEQLGAMLERTEGVFALELNLTPLALHEEGFVQGAIPSESESLSRIRQALKAVRAQTRLPLIAKLPSVGIEIGLAAKTAVDTGADVIAVGQAFPAVAVRLSSRELRLPYVVGGLSGPAIKPLALYQVWRVRQSISAPIIGSGGIMSADDAEEFMIAGADAVAIGIASLVKPSTLANCAKRLRYSPQMSQ